MSYIKYKSDVLLDRRSQKLNFEVDGRSHVVYRVTHKRLGLYYYGSKTDNDYGNSVGITYFTSSSDDWFRNDFQNNRGDWVVKIIKVFDNPADKMIMESYLHTKFSVSSNHNFINRQTQTPYGFDLTGLKFPKIIEVEQTKNLHQKELSRRILMIKGRIIMKFFRLRHNTHGNVGKKRTQEQKEKNKMAYSGENNGMYGKKHSQKSRSKMSRNNVGMIGKSHTTSTKKLMSNSAKTRKACEMFTCPTCGKSGASRNMYRWHGKDGSRCKV